MSPIDDSPRSGRGFALMNKDIQRAIASKGGASVPAELRSFAQNRSLAVAAGRKGGLSKKSPRDATRNHDAEHRRD